MASGGDKVEQGVNTVVTEAGITLNPGLLRQNIIILSFQISENLLKAVDGLRGGWRRLEQGQGQRQRPILRDD